MPRPVSRSRSRRSRREGRDVEDRVRRARRSDMVRQRREEWERAAQFPALERDPEDPRTEYVAPQSDARRMQRAMMRRAGVDRAHERFLDRAPHAWLFERVARAYPREFEGTAAADGHLSIRNAQSAAQRGQEEAGEGPGPAGVDPLPHLPRLPAPAVHSSRRDVLPVAHIVSWARRAYPGRPHVCPAHNCGLAFPSVDALMSHYVVAHDRRLKPREEQEAVPQDADPRHPLSSTASLPPGVPNPTAMEAARRGEAIAERAGEAASAADASRESAAATVHRVAAAVEGLSVGQLAERRRERARRRSSRQRTGAVQQARFPGEDSVADARVSRATLEAMEGSENAAAALVAAGMGQGVASAPGGGGESRIDADTRTRLHWLVHAVDDMYGRGQGAEGPLRTGPATGAGAPLRASTTHGHAAPEPPRVRPQREGDARSGPGAVVRGSGGRRVATESRGLDRYLPYRGAYAGGAASGLGVAVFAGGDGGSHIGEWATTAPSGHGLARYPDGTTHVGGYVHGKRQGLGTLALPNGARYEGHWLSGSPHGRGILRYPGGLVYEGTFAHGQRSGQGRMRSELTGWEYVGEWKEDCVEGFGAVTHLRTKRSLSRHWPPRTFHDTVREARDELEDEEWGRVEERRERRAPLEEAKLARYVQGVRDRMAEEARKLEEERERERREFYEEIQRQRKEAMEKAMGDLLGSK